MVTGTRVRLIHNPYEPMLRLPVGTLGKVTRGGSAIVSVRFDNGTRAKCWMLRDGNGRATLEAVRDAHGEAAEGRVVDSRRRVARRRGHGTV